MWRVSRGRARQGRVGSGGRGEARGRERVRKGCAGGGVSRGEGEEWGEG